MDDQDQHEHVGGGEANGTGQTPPPTGSGQPVEPPRVSGPPAPTKVRVFALDKETGKPLKGVTLRAVATINQAGGGEREVTVGLLATDHAGYAAFDVTKVTVTDSALLAQGESLGAFWIVPLHDPQAKVEALPWLGRHADYPIVHIPTNRPVFAKGEAPVPLPSIQAADMKDWEESPASFASEAMAIVGEPGCEQLLLSRAVEEVFHFSQVIRAVSSASRPLTPTIGKPVLYRKGALLEYEMLWQPVGHALGKILYSLPLAPCESVRVAIIDWSRQDETVRGESTGFAEQLAHSQYRDRSIAEAVDFTLRERQSGDSFLAGTAGVGGFGNSLFGVFGSHAIGGGSSSSSGVRHIAGDTSQQLADGVQQASNFMRRLNSTVVVQASQLERERLETRIVTNHNHCHALTVLYYEIVRHFLVTTRLAHKRDVIFIQYPLIDLSEAKIEETVLRYRRVLERFLLDKSLLPCFGVTQRLACERLDFDPSTVMLASDDFEMSELRIRTTTGDRGGGDPTVAIVPLHGDQVPCRVVDPPIAGPSWAILPRANGGLSPGAEGFFTLQPSLPVRWGNVRQLRFKMAVHRDGPASGTWDLAALHAWASHGDHEWVLYNRAVGRPVEGDQAVYVDVDRYGGPRRPEHKLTLDERCCVEKLKRHLLDNQVYYSKAVWLTEDPDERARRLEAYTYTEIGEGRGGLAVSQTGSLVDFIENRPIGVSGDYVAFAIAGDEVAREVDWGEARRIVSLPTRGAFAEAKLSHCNACEKRDPTRFWKWQESPCPEPPEISPLIAGSRARDTVGTTPTAMPVPGIGIQAPPEAPAPQGMAAVMDLLKQPEIFRNMSMSTEVAGLLGKLTDAASEMAKTQIETAGEVEVARIQAESGQEQPGNGDTAGGPGAVQRAGAATGALQPTTTGRGAREAGEGSAEDLHDRATVAHQDVSDRVASGDMTPEEGAEQHRRVTGNVVGSTGQPEPAPHWRLPHRVHPNAIYVGIRSVLVPDLQGYEDLALGFQLAVPGGAGGGGQVQAPLIEHAVAGRVAVIGWLELHPSRVIPNIEEEARSGSIENPEAWTRRYFFRVSAEGSIEAEDIEAPFQVTGTQRQLEVMGGIPIMSADELLVLYPDAFANTPSSVRGSEEEGITLEFPTLNATVTFPLEGEGEFAFRGVDGSLEFTTPLPGR